MKTISRPSLCIVFILAASSSMNEGARAEEVSGADQKAAIDRLIATMPQGVESPDACIRSFATPELSGRAIGYGAEFNDAQKPKWIITGLISETRILSQAANRFTHLVCTRVLRRFKSDQQFAPKITVSPDLESRQSKWSRNHSSDYCEKWVMKRDGQAISVAATNGWRASFPESTCNCAIGRCNYVERGGADTDYSVATFGKFDGGVFVQMEFYNVGPHQELPGSPTIT